MLVLDHWTAHRLVRGMVAYHDALNQNADPDRAFLAASGLRFNRELVPQVLIDYPDLNAAACAVLDLDRNYRDGVEGWTPDEISDWVARREKSVSRLQMVRLMVDASLKGFDWPSPHQA